jgi:hypothetical protein
VFAPNPKLRRAVTALVIGNGAPLTSKKAAGVYFNPGRFFRASDQPAMYPQPAQFIVLGAG